MHVNVEFSFAQFGCVAAVADDYPEISLRGNNPEQAREIPAGFESTDDFDIETPVRGVWGRA